MRINFRLLCFPKYLWLSGSLLIAVSCLSQKTQPAGNAVYKVFSKGLSFKTTDSILLKGETVQIPIGTLLYKTYYGRGYSRTDFAFETTAGFRGNGQADLTSMVTRERDSSLFLFDENGVKESYRYRLPKLIKTGETKTIKTYACESYRYRESDSSSTLIWFCKKLPFWVSPGVYYKAFGGIVRIDYVRPKAEDKWSLELVSFERTINKLSEEVSLVKQLPAPKGASRIHFLFKKS